MLDDSRKATVTIIHYRWMHHHLQKERKIHCTCVCGYLFLFVWHLTHHYCFRWHRIVRRCCLWDTPSQILRWHVGINLNSDSSLITRLGQTPDLQHPWIDWTVVTVVIVVIAAVVIIIVVVKKWWWRNSISSQVDRTTTTTNYIHTIATTNSFLSHRRWSRWWWWCNHVVVVVVSLPNSLVMMCDNCFNEELYGFNFENQGECLVFTFIHDPSSWWDNKRRMTRGGGLQ